VADAVIDVVGAEDLPTIVELYNQIFRPPRTVEAFQRRFRGRHNILHMIARVDGKPVGFFLGFELKPDTFFAWFYGVVPDGRRLGVGSQMMDAAHEWAKQNGYEVMRLECQNAHRPMLHLAIELGYDIVGMRWDADRGTNLIIFEKQLNG
jgi:GNAT superfamily N-acetyltransferase